jgi:hypothetical protein
MEGLCADRPSVAQGPGRRAHALRTSAGGCADRLFQSSAHRDRHLDTMPHFPCHRRLEYVSERKNHFMPGTGRKLGCTRSGRETSLPSACISGNRTLLSVNQPSRFDCPGCAWPDPTHTTGLGQHADIEVCARDVRALDQRMARHPRATACCALTVDMMGGCDAGH